MISIIIPVYDEAKDIRKLIDYLNDNSFGYIYEIIVADGGSTDNIQEKLIDYRNVKYIHTGKGRSKQMNSGAKIAQGTILYFLHADTFPPRYFDEEIIKVLSHKKQIKAGCFNLKFNSKHWWLTLMGWATAINHNVCRGGDQSLFVDRELFFALNGFNEGYEVYEDNDLTKKLYQHTNFKIIKKPVVTSARHYNEIGVWRLQWLHLVIYWKKWSGASAEELNNFYKERIKTLKLSNR